MTLRTELRELPSGLRLLRLIDDSGDLMYGLTAKNGWWRRISEEEYDALLPLCVEAEGEPDRIYMLPCPFCGRKRTSLYSFEDRTGKRFYVVQCKCGASMKARTPFGAIGIWNVRMNPLEVHLSDMASTTMGELTELMDADGAVRQDEQEE